MKRALLFLLLCFSLAVQAQTLNLKKGQKLSYEILEITDHGSNLYMTYNEFDFLIKAVTKDAYIITVSRPRYIAKDYKDMADSRFELSAQPNRYMAIAKKVLSTMSYQVTVNKTGEVQEVQGLEPIIEKVSAAFKERKTTESYSQEDFIQSAFSVKNFKSQINRILSVKPVADVDTIKTGARRYAVTNRAANGVTKKDSVFTIDTMMIKKSAGHEVKTGLLISALNDSTANSTSLKTGELRFYRFASKINLKESNVKALGFGPLLLEEIKKGIDYDNYFSPAGMAAQKVTKMLEVFGNTKGKLGVKDSILKVLDTLDRQMKDTDYPYWAEKVKLIGRLGINAESLIRKIPYEYLTADFYVLQKLEYELKENNTENFAKAINLVFTKFGKGRNYPLNVHVLVNAIHDEWAKHVFNTNDKAVLLPILNSINEVEKLNFPRFNAMLAGLKTYTQVKLTDDNKQLAVLISSNTSAPYDKYGRYRLLIYDELSKRQVADSIRMNYIDLTIDKLKKAVADSSDFAKSLKHVQRKYLGDAYYRKSQLMGSAGLNYLQTAAEYVPSQEDKIQNNGDLEPEYIYLPFMAYNEIYMAKAEATGGSKDAVLEKYAEMVIIEPERYGILKEKYLKTYPNGNFKTWFAKVLKAKLPVSPVFALEETSGKKVGNAEHKNKFIFIDFWGTWCGACISEIHKVEELHVKNDKPEKLMVTTIACFDKKQYVIDFMAKRNYTYQVLMSDNSIEGKFKVQHYPTKLLLLPIGTYIVIPNTEDYKALVDKYLEWEI